MKIGYCLTGSFCTFDKTIKVIEKLVNDGHIVTCTGNTLAKLSNGIVDTTVTMAVKSHLRNNRPVVIGISTNDALGGAAKNIGTLLNYKNYYFVPFGMDNFNKKPKSMVCDFDKVCDTIINAEKGIEILKKIY